MKRNIIALDVGTQSVRAALIDVGGEIVGLEQIQQEVDTPIPIGPNSTPILGGKRPFRRSEPFSAEQAFR